jgi:hypothetical protein
MEANMKTRITVSIILIASAILVLATSALALPTFQSPLPPYPPPLPGEIPTLRSCPTSCTYGCIWYSYCSEVPDCYWPDQPLPTPCYLSPLATPEQGVQGPAPTPTPIRCYLPVIRKEQGG